MGLTMKEVLRMSMAKREFKKHYRKAMHLKEGGTAWEREIALAEKYLEIAKKEYQENWKAKYCY